MLAVEGILALHHAGMYPVTQVLACGLQCGGNVKIRYGRELNRRIFQRGMLIADGAGGYDHISGQHIHGDAAAGAHTNEGVSANGSQFFHGNGCRRAADTG